MFLLWLRRHPKIIFADLNLKNWIPSAPVQFSFRVGWVIKTPALSLSGKKRESSEMWVEHWSQNQGECPHSSRCGRERTGAETRHRVPAWPLAFLFPCLPFHPTAWCSYRSARGGGGTMPRPTFYWAYAANRLVNSANWQNFAENYSLCPLNTSLFWD